MRLSLLIVCVLMACAGSPRPIAMPYSAQLSPEASRPVVLERAIDPSLEALGLPSLAGVALPTGYRELRLSRGPGMILGEEYPVIRVLESPAGVRGEIIRCRSFSDTSTRTIRWTARRVRPARAVDWTRLLAGLDQLNVNGFEAPVYRTAITDAGDLVVEIRRGAEYRAYEVNAPQLREDSVSQRAAMIAAVVDSLGRLTRGYD